MTDEEVTSSHPILTDFNGPQLICDISSDSYYKKIYQAMTPLPFPNLNLSIQSDQNEEKQNLGENSNNDKQLSTTKSHPSKTPKNLQNDKSTLELGTNINSQTKARVLFKSEYSMTFNKYHQLQETSPLSNLTVSHSNLLFAFCCFHNNNINSIYIFDYKKKKLKITLSTSYFITFISFSSDDTKIAASLANGTISVWDITKDKPFPIWTSSFHNSHNGIATSLYWENDYIISGGYDGIINLWDPRLPPLDSLKDSIDIGHPILSLVPNLATTDNYLIISFIFELNSDYYSRPLLTFSSNYFPLNCIHKLPSNSHYFSILTDSTFKIMHEKCLEPLCYITLDLIKTTSEPKQTIGCWCKNRTSIFFIADYTGNLFVYDFSHSFINPVFSININNTA